MEFKELKEEILRLAKEEDACVDGYKEGLQAQNKSDLLKAITNNWVWAMRITGIIDAGFLEENFTKQELNDAHIYTNGYHKILNSSAFVCGCATVEAYDCSELEVCDCATVIARDYTRVIARGFSTVIAHGHAIVEAYEESYIEDCTGNLVPAGGHAIVKDCYGDKIYIKKGSFEIVEIN